MTCRIAWETVAKAAVVLAVAALMASIILSVALLRSQVISDTPAQLYVIDVPIAILDREIPGVVGPSQRANIDDQMTTSTIRCLRTETPVPISYSLTWTSEAGESIQSVDDFLTVTGEPGGAGCEGSTDEPIRENVTLPDGGLPPGRWRFVSQLVLFDPDTGQEIERELSTSEWVTVR